MKKLILIVLMGLSLTLPGCSKTPSIYTDEQQDYIDEHEGEIIYFEGRVLIIDDGHKFFVLQYGREEEYSYATSQGGRAKLIGYDVEKNFIHYEYNGTIFTYDLYEDEKSFSTIMRNGKLVLHTDEYSFLNNMFSSVVYDRDMNIIFEDDEANIIIPFDGNVEWTTTVFHTYTKGTDTCTINTYSDILNQTLLNSYLVSNGNGCGNVIVSINNIVKIEITGLHERDIIGYAFVEQDGSVREEIN